ncbi:MAG: zinc ribbon domain-containing protein [Chloroflexi bacterium]|nr:zinc ribbon domain-containing protein [Chloroflexota bacterium]
MQCPNCGFENTDPGPYCAQCGTPLNVWQPIPDQTEVSAPEIEYGQYSVPPPPPLNGHETIPPPPPPPSEYDSYSIQSQIFTDQKITPRPGIGVFSAILYFLGALITAFGLIVTIVAFGANMGGIALLLGIALLIASVVIFIRLRRRSPLLRWWQRLLWILGATLVGLITLIIETIAVHNPTVTNIFIGCVFMLYGFAWAAIAVW